MKVLIVGAGLTGCTFARLLCDRGHQVEVWEKENHIGGLCRTITTEFCKYEPFGARTFHTKRKDVWDFVNQFSRFNGYTHNKGVIIDGKLYHFPLSWESVKKMPFQVKRELPLDKTNFETCMKSVFGKTLYKKFIGNYTKKMWGINPSELTAEWAVERIPFTQKNEPCFGSERQGLPINGYTEMLEKMLFDIEVILNCPLEINKANYDIVLYSGRIDNYFDEGNLPYRSLKFSYVTEPWDDMSYGTINLPQHPSCIRKANFGVLHKQLFQLIQYQEPVRVDSKNPPMYPVNTVDNNRSFETHLRWLVKEENVIPVGRLGLYKYLNMDQAVGLAMDMIPLVESWGTMDTNSRFNKIMEVRNGSS